MAQEVLSYPFRIDRQTGGFAKVSSSSDIYKAQQTASIVRTNTGERKIFQSFGILDPAFYEFDSGEFYNKVSDFYPTSEINITDISVGLIDGRITDVVVTFD